MRSVLVFLLLFAIMLPTFTPWGTVAYFHINRKYIARVLCENRDKPKLNCNGKCYLAKKLKEQQDKETTERVENMPLAQLFYIPALRFSFVMHNTALADNVLFYYRMTLYASHFQRILRPPQIN